MGSDLYRVKVLDRQDRVARLHLSVVHPDSNYLSDNASFALMLLHEGLRGTTNAPLAQEISFEDTLDRGWLDLYTLGFVDKAEVKIESGSQEGTTPEQWLKGVLTITATDPAWVAHLSPGAEYDSRAFDAAYDFQPCAPIRPGQIDPNAPVADAFISCPGALWENSGLPAVVRVPAYSASAYRSPSLKKGTFQAADLKDLDGQVVLHQGPYDDSMRLGLLSIAGDSIRLFSAGDGGFGSQSSTQFEGSIGLAEPIPGKRLGSRLKASSIVRNLKPTLRAAAVEGTSAVFRVALPPGSEGLGELTEEQRIALGFHLLVQPLLPTGFASETIYAPSPLSWTLEREVMRLFPAEERQVTSYINNQMVPVGDTMPEISGLTRRVARGFVAQVEVSGGGPLVSAAELDAMPDAQRAGVLAQPWPEVMVRVTPHDPAYLAHLSRPVPPASLPQHFGDAEPWQGPLPTPAIAATGFGQKKAAAPGAPVPSAPTGGGGGSSDTLKKVGIGCAILTALMLFCCIASAIFNR